VSAAARLQCALLAAPLLSACVTRVVLEPRDLDRLLGEMGSESVARTEHYTLWAPGDWLMMRPWLALVEEERAAVVTAFGGAEPVPRVQVVLVPVQGMWLTLESGPNGTLAVRAPEGGDPTHGLEGWASDHGVAVHVPATTYIDGPDGLRLPSVSSPENHRRTLRHELAHWRALGLGLRGGDWLEEGLAQVLEGLELEDGRLVDRGPSADTLKLADALGVRTLALEELLDWREDGGRIVEMVHGGRGDGDLGVQPAPRTASGLYVRFLLGLEGSGEPAADFAARFAVLVGIPRAEHLAGEADWRAWLEAEILRSAPAAVGG
jgi:hypothetical protein